MSQLIDATFVYPSKVTQLAGMHSFGLLRSTGLWSMVDYVVFLVPALWAVARTARPRRFDLAVWLLAVWVVVGTLLSLTQKWNPYQRLNALTPLALLGLWGVDRLAAGRTLSHRSLRPMFAVAALGALPALGLFGRDMLRLAQNHLALTKRWEQAYVDGADDANRGIADERGTLPRPKEGNETWYVLGDPLWYPALGVDQGLPINGWSPEQFVPAQWDRLRAEMGQFHPDRVLVDDFSYATIVERDPKTLALLQARYDLAGKTSGGSKQAVSEYVLRSAP